MTYQERIHDLREDNDFTQNTVATYLGIAQTTYSQYEFGKRSLPIELVIELCKFYNVSADYLLGLTNKKKPFPKD